jgi:lysophospholipid acyltransferase (LPLAT)-like uncharacterized protein
MKKLVRKIYNSKPFGWCIHKLILFLFYTNKRQIIGKEILSDLEKTKSAAIICFWHGRLLPMPLIAPEKQRVRAVVSRHADGEFLSNVIENFGAKTIRGSSNRKKDNSNQSKNRGGAHAVRGVIEAIKGGFHIVVTPDGPKGPRMQFKDNIFKIAQSTGTPIINMAFAATNSIVFNSWDKFIFPLPFGKIVVKVSDPVIISENITPEQLETVGKQIENDLNKISTEVDLLCNKTPIKP